MRQFDQFIFGRHSLLAGGGRMESAHELAELDGGAVFEFFWRALIFSCGKGRLAHTQREFLHGTF